MEVDGSDDFPFRLGDFVRCHVNFQGCKSGKWHFLETLLFCTNGGFY